MQTITLARINHSEVNTSQFVRRVRSVKVTRELNVEAGAVEELDAPLADQLNSKTKPLRGLATAIIRRKRPATVATISIVKGYLQRNEAEEETEDFTRVWLGYKKYALLCFMSGFPGGTYPSHRLMIARSLTQAKLEADQDVVKAVGYDLSCVRDSFGNNLWDQNFKRTSPISHGRIQGTAMEMDPLYEQAFDGIGTFIGVEIPTTGKTERVKVFSDGRLQFMGLQPGLLEDQSSRDQALEMAIEVIDQLSSCET